MFNQNLTNKIDNGKKYRLERVLEMVFGVVYLFQDSLKHYDCFYSQCKCYWCLGIFMCVCGGIGLGVCMGVCVCVCRFLVSIVDTHSHIFI